MINEQIRDKEVRLIGEDGEQLGIVSSRDALKMACLLYTSDAADEL